MTQRNMRILLEKLNPECASAMESAVFSCRKKGNYELAWEQVLLILCESASNDIACIFDHFGIDCGRIKKNLQQEIAQLACGNAGKPSFSPVLISIMERAWILASLYFGEKTISSGMLFAAALDRTQRSVDGCPEPLRDITEARLVEELVAITAPSPEHKKNAGENHSITQALSGDAAGQYCVNFTGLAAENRLDPVTGRDEEIRQVVDILCRRRKNNPILVGEAGTGKTAVIEGLAQRIVSGNVPENLRGVEILGLDAGLLQAGAGIRGEFEKRLKGIVDTVKASAGRIVLFIDEAHTLIGAGGQAGQGDAANLLKPALARGELRTCAATTWAEYRRYFEKDSALARRFQPVNIDEPDERKAVSMLRGIAGKYEKHHGVILTDEAIRAAVCLSKRYLTSRQLPDKAVDVMDTAAARVKLSLSTIPAAIERATMLCEEARQNVEALERDIGSGMEVDTEKLENFRSEAKIREKEIPLLHDKWEREKACAAKIMELTKKRNSTGDSAQVELTEKIRELGRELCAIQNGTPMVFPQVTREVCAAVISDWTGVPAGSMLADEAARLVNLEQDLKQRIAGQDMALSRISGVVRASKTRMGNPDAPMGVLLFTGPSGVGKTECALALADILFGGENFLTVINMSEYQEKHSVSQLKGSPPGYAGYGEGGVLTEAVRQKPYSMVMLDETEKAHPEVMNMFYQVFDKGFMRDGEGRKIDFRNTLIVMTSNLGSERITETVAANPEVSPDEIIKAVRPHLSARFNPALLGRMTIIPFFPLSRESLYRIISLKLEKTAQRIREAYGTEIIWSPELTQTIAGMCAAPEYGARAADTVLQQKLLPEISVTLLSSCSMGEKACKRITVKTSGNGGFQIDCDDGV